MWAGQGVGTQGVFLFVNSDPWGEGKKRAIRNRLQVGSWIGKEYEGQGLEIKGMFCLLIWTFLGVCVWGGGGL